MSSSVTTISVALLGASVAQAGMLQDGIDLFKRQVEALRVGLEPLQTLIDDFGDDGEGLPNPAVELDEDDVNNDFNDDVFQNQCKDFALADALLDEDENLVITQGEQVVEGSFSVTMHGDISNEVITTRFNKPKNGAVIPANVPVQFELTGSNYATSVFLDAQVDYYRDPQIQIEDGDQQFPIGHVHVTCEFVNGEVQITDDEDGNEFAFFQGINAGEPDALIAQNFDGFAETGLLRCCTLPAGYSHQCLVFTELDRIPEMDCAMYIVRDDGIAGEPEDLSEAGYNNLAQPGQLA